MGQSIASPTPDEKVLGRVAKFMRLIAKAGITPEVMQLLINDAAIRRRFITGLSDLVRAVQQPVAPSVNLGVINGASLRKMLGLVWRSGNVDTIDRIHGLLNNRPALETLLYSLDNDRARTIAVLYYDLDSRQTSPTELARMFNVSVSVIRQQLKKILDTTRMFVASSDRSMIEITQDHLDFALLGFDPHLRNILWRNRINDISTLTCKSEVDLLYLGETHLEQVKAKLATRGLSLSSLSSR